MRCKDQGTCGINGCKICNIKLRQQTKTPRDKPRHHAEAILLLPTREARKLALEQVQEDIRHVVRFYCEAEFSKRQRKPLPDLEKP